MGSGPPHPWAGAPQGPGRDPRDSRCFPAAPSSTLPSGRTRERGVRSRRPPATPSAALSSASQVLFRAASLGPVPGPLTRHPPSSLSQRHVGITHRCRLPCRREKRTLGRELALSRGGVVGAGVSFRGHRAWMWTVKWMCTWRAAAQIKPRGVLAEPLCLVPCPPHFSHPASLGPSHRTNGSCPRAFAQRGSPTPATPDSVNLLVSQLLSSCLKAPESPVASFCLPPLNPNLTRLVRPTAVLAPSGSS